MTNLKKKILIQSIVLGCIILVFAIFFILFKQNIENKIKIIDQFKARKLLFAQSSSDIVMLKGEWETARQYTDDLAQYAPKKNDLVLIPQNIKNLGREHNVTITFTYGQETNTTQTGATPSVQFTAAAEGTAQAIRAFMQAFDTQFHTIQIDSLDSTMLSGSALRVSMVGKVQYYE